MWQYNPDSYSSSYVEDNKLPLDKNMCCLAYFSGDFQPKNFESGFYLDVYRFTYMPETLNEKYSIKWTDQHKALALDPLNKYNKDQSYLDFNLGLYRGQSLQNSNKLFKQNDSYQIPHTKIPLVKKIAVARPMRYTGVVKTMLFIFANDEISGQYDEFQEFDNKDSLIEAKTLGKIVNHVENEEIEYIEYLENKYKSNYPAL